MWDEQISKRVGYSRVMANVPLGADEALEINNFGVDEQGFLDSTVRLMPLVPDEWYGGTTNQQPDPFSQVHAMEYTNFGQDRRDEILFITDGGVYRFAPWKRGDATSADPFPYLEPVYHYRYDGTLFSPIPQTQRLYPPQMEAVGKYIYFNMGDGTPSWVWDGVRLREFGYKLECSSPSATGPGRHNNLKLDAESDLSANEGGFKFTGRIGSIDPRMYRTNDKAATHRKFEKRFTGGITVGDWQYYVVWENEAGAYSKHAGIGAPVHMNKRINTNYGVVESLTRRFWLNDVPIGPEGTVARILLRTPNLRNLPRGMNPTPHFLHRIPNNSAREYVDDIPDGELGSEWKPRAVVPSGTTLMKYFSGSLFLMRNEAYPARVWWSEQEDIFGGIPESFMEGHWLDVYPETGPITGAVSVRLPEGGGAALLIFKERAIHAIVGEYPKWKSITIRLNAGLSGPNLVQSAPDGSVVFFGNGTFWRYTPSDGNVLDIGQGLRKRLRRINTVKARIGVSWVESDTKEVYFVLPIDDSEVPNQTFVFDYRNAGWRLRDDWVVNSALSVRKSSLVLVHGRHTPTT